MSAMTKICFFVEDVARSRSVQLTEDVVRQTYWTEQSVVGWGGLHIILWTKAPRETSVGT